MKRIYITIITITISFTFLTKIENVEASSTTFIHIHVPDPIIDDRRSDPGPIIRSFGW